MNVPYELKVYLPWDSMVPTSKTTGPIVIALFTFISYAIVLNTVIPLSLYVR